MERLLEVGYRNQHPKFGWYEVIEKVDNTHYIVKFDSTGYQYSCSKYHILNNHVCDKRNEFFHQIGEKYEHPIYGKYHIIEFLKGKKAIIEFEKTKYQCECTICNIKNNRVKDVMFPIVCGVGYIGEQRNLNSKKSKNEAYTCWRNMLKRCYDKDIQDKRPTYINCKVSQDWHCFIEFEKWFNENYIQDWCLDKDILIKGNREYSPKTCCFVPCEINSLLTKRQNHRGNTPIGVKYCKAKRRLKDYYKASFTKGNEKVYLGSFKTPEEAFQAYKVAKEEWIKEVANKYKEKLEPRVYDALMKYEVEITD